MLLRLKIDDPVDAVPVSKSALLSHHVQILITAIAI